MTSSETSTSDADKPYTPRGSITPFLAGAASGLVASVTLQPFDVVKTRMQAASFAGNRQNMIVTARTLVQAEGLKVLWAGVGPACIRLGAGAGLYFLLLDRLRGVIKQHAPGSDGVGTALQTMGTGAFSRSVAAAVLCPVTVVKTRMEYAGVSGITYTSTAAALVNIARKERLRGLFSGLGPTVLRDAPFSGLYLLLYTRLQKGMKGASGQYIPPTTPPFVLNFISGAIAGAVATLITHPPDVLRARLQLNHYSKAGVVSASQNLGPQSLSAIVRKEGLGALMVGAGPRVVRRTLQMAMTWSMYEEIVKVIDDITVGKQTNE